MNVLMPPSRWCIYIDILGFSALWESEELKAVGSLQELMRAIYRIGRRVYPNEGERLFVHHMGDGFAIVSDFGEASLQRPIAIAITLMRSVATTGMFAGAAIAEGEFADISGCYPTEVTEDLDDGHVIGLGAGLMTLSSVMGTAFIRAYRLSHDAPPGPLLILPKSCRHRIPAALTIRETTGRKGTPILSIDWIHAEPALFQSVQEQAGLRSVTPPALADALNAYCIQYSLREKWCEVWALLESE